MSENVFICSISSDIGGELASLFRRAGSRVVGTYRSSSHAEQWRNKEGVELLHCDISSSESIAAATGRLAELDTPWDIFVGAAGQLDPIGPFFECDVDEWCKSVALNSIGQLRLLHAIYPYRNKQALSKVVFLVGGGINNAFTNYSAYCLGKITLIKMCELLDDEYPNVHAIAVGTGWVNTKIHAQTLNAEGRAGDNYRRTIEFVSSSGQGTSYADIYNCIKWCFSKNRRLTGGRNFSVVHDAWRDPASSLAHELAQDKNKFRLRRSGG